MARLALTIGLEVGSDCFITSLNLLDWEFGCAFNRNYWNLAVGPLSFSLMRKGGLEELVDDLREGSE